MLQKIKHIAILGGGTSGWLAAAYLLNNIENIKITVIDKEVGTPVGVGEGTLLNFGDFLKSCGFSIDEWFPAVNATYKTGILFPGWGQKDKEVWHPFLMNPNVLEDVRLMDLWTANQEMPFKEYGIPCYKSCVVEKKIDVTEKIGYHVDCGLLVNFIKNKIIHKINFIQSEMISVSRNVNRDIEHLELKNGQNVEADLFLDCSGFKHLLNDMPKRVNLSGRLFCNTALAAHIPYIDRKKEMNPYVVSEAVDCGWIWNIPVTNRIGSGIVFNRDITDIEEAKDIFVKYWDYRITKEQLKLIDWTPFYNENFWQNNVVSIGLSAGFIEPLESTGIALIMEGIHQLAERILDNFYTENEVTLYNQTMKCFFEECIDFVSMHYSETDRSDPFWQNVKETFIKSNRQKFFEEELLNPYDTVPDKNKNTNFFCGANWSLWLIQLGYSVANRRNTILQNIDSKKIFNLSYNKTEKFRSVWSRLHYEEIERTEAFYRMEEK